MGAPVPRSMARGSRGPHVALLRAFLCGMGFGRGLGSYVCYDGAMASKMKILQAEHGLDPTGDLDGATQALLRKKYSFNFRAACRAIPGVTIFLQRSGPPIRWSRAAA